jgi:hypothetical protein
MSTEPIAAATTASHDPQPNYEFLQVRATVINFTDQEMVLTGYDLSWGKWIQPPANVPAHDLIPFGSQGRDSSPSGTEGWANWRIGGADIKVTFGCPFVSGNFQTISCNPPLFDVAVTGTGSDINYVFYKIKPKK